jgi:hypothetical protein
MLAKDISKAANDAGVHLSTFLQSVRVNRSSFYKWSSGECFAEKNRVKMELLLIHLEKMKHLKKSLEEKIDVNTL